MTKLVFILLTLSQFAFASSQTIGSFKGIVTTGAVVEHEFNLTGGVATCGTISEYGIQKCSVEGASLFVNRGNSPSLNISFTKLVISKYKGKYYYYYQGMMKKNLGDVEIERNYSAKFALLAGTPNQISGTLAYGESSYGGSRLEGYEVQ